LISTVYILSTTIAAMEMPAHIWHLIARTLNGEASFREREELSQMLRNDSLLQQQYEILSRIWKDNADKLLVEDSDAARTAISRIMTRAEVEIPLPEMRSKSRFGSKRAWLVAASIAVMAAVSWMFMTSSSASNKTEQPKNESIVAQNGSRIRSLLPDGTTVWLNVGSKLLYGDFSGPTREVKLEGEAFFDVVKNPDRPFIVHTSGIDIKVLGTSFNVKSYPEDKTVETTLYHGKVKVFRTSETETSAVELKPNEKLVLNKEAAIKPIILSESHSRKTYGNIAEGITITLIDSTKKEYERFETAWIYSRLEFRGDNFEELARKLERWYNVKVIFKEETAKQLNFNGSFEKETVEQAFVALKTAVPFEYEIRGNEIYVAAR
jgi:ferric-dicitrate binding protein FerR (iron transport regulator)